MIPVLYQDDQILAVDKPAWSVVHPTRGADGALVLVRALREQLGGDALHPVHRLDRQTSGVLLLARTPLAAAQLSAQVREGLWRKSYLGLCRGVLRESRLVDHGVKEGAARRPAATLFSPLEVLCERYTLLEAEPRGGRRHQIRYHLKHISHPLAGDVRYGRGDLNRFFRETFGLRRLFLHAASLRLPHPVEPRLLELRSELPGELQEVLARMRGYQGPVV